MDEPRFLIIETSHRQGKVALALGDRIVGRRLLEESRRHARDLAPFTQELLREQGWKPRDLAGVIVSRGPGSYTGLRVGLMSAKTLAYATGCALLSVETFAAVALQVPQNASNVFVIADAQQDKIYVQHFALSSKGEWAKSAELSIVPFGAWKNTLRAADWVTGPGLEAFAERLPSHVHIAERCLWLPDAESLLRLGCRRWQAKDKDDVYALEPIYLRPSAAEIKSQESRVRSQESGVKSQESRVRSQESGVKSQESEVKGQQSGELRPLTPDP
ncbi:MAG: tRNA (adenosine(37)-N6)-threonylcarbamoyltransferase complex dimerization subunit type 1 TsaB [Gemmataceae bacterium]|nr:tRNA (adenosine(37)-N6)-threonylcarbamoyltransferase complex dimerization subunit type 1 TsaB [Gemmataceae bacterium]